jgi:hypothetical protein
MQLRLCSLQTSAPFLPWEWDQSAVRALVCACLSWLTLAGLKTSLFQNSQGQTKHFSFLPALSSPLSNSYISWWLALWHRTMWSTVICKISFKTHNHCWQLVCLSIHDRWENGYGKMKSPSCWVSRTEMKLGRVWRGQTSLPPLCTAHLVDLMLPICF